MKNSLLAALAALAFAAPASASAAYLLTVKGTVVEADDGIPDNGPDFVGQTFTATVQYDLTKGTRTTDSSEDLLVYGPTNPFDFITLTLSGGSVFNFTAGFGTNIAVNSSNLLTFNNSGGLHLAFSNPSMTSLSQTFPLVSVGDSITSDFTAGDAWGLLDIEQASITNVSAAIPEPSTWALMIMGFGTIGALLRRRQLALA